MNFLILFFEILAASIAALTLVVLVLPKVDSLCTLPMPPLRSYLLGHAYDFLDVRFLLRTQMRWFRNLGDVFQIWIVHRRVVVTSHPQDVAAVLGKPDLFARPPAQTALFNDLQPDNFQTMARDVHRAHRNRMRDAFSPSTIRAFSNTVADAAEDLVSRMRAYRGEPVDFTPQLADTTFRVLLEAVLGSSMDVKERSIFARESRAFLTELLIEYCTYPLRRVFAFLGIRRRLFKKHRTVKRFAARLVDKRSEETEEARNARPFDMMDVIRELNPDDRERQISNTTMFAIAGFESSSEALAWAIYEITARPDVIAKIQEEVDTILGEKKRVEYDDVQLMTYTQQAWRETLRLHPSAGFLLRVATRDTELPGTRVTIPAGVQVGALIAAAQRHPDYIKDPDSFRPERWEVSKEKSLSRAYLAFSTGPERCPGRDLADFECVAILAALFRAFDISLAVDRGEIEGISDWTERARCRAEGKPEGDLSWSVPVRLLPRKRDTTN